MKLEKLYIDSLGCYMNVEVTDQEPELDYFDWKMSQINQLPADDPFIAYLNQAIARS